MTAASACFVSRGYHATKAKTMASKAGVATGAFNSILKIKKTCCAL
ncbi:TetR family transcriptional regulator [Zhongshania sp.]